ncbi:MAG: HEAT repeat domain-containing protein [Deltaproteobacteria bacterium]|nr:HEAT repeat domain-containing protein [Deltaproteobacteria bacterium]
MTHNTAPYPTSASRSAWPLLIALIVVGGLTAGCEKFNPITGEDEFDLNIREWHDDSGAITNASFEQLLKTKVVTPLPRLAQEGVSVLFVRGTLTTITVRSDDPRYDQSEMMLEGRFLYSDMSAAVHLPVKVVVLGRIDGTDPKKRNRLVLGAMTDLQRGLASHIRICNGTAKRWVAALKSPEPDEQILALSLLQQYRKKFAASKVIELLNDPRIEVGQAAVEAASELADQRHANRIIEIAQGGGIEVEARCIQVLSRIGGEDAVAWLEMLALGHQNSQMRELSFNALKRLK